MINSPHLKNHTDDHLIALLKAGDNKAFEFLYDNYNEALFKVIKKIISDNDDASDTLQDAFVNIYKKIETYDASKGRLFTWMLNIAVNASIDKVRSAGYRHIKNTCSIDRVNDKIWLTGASVEKISMAKTLEILSSLQRELIHLSYYKGYTHEQISAIQGMPVGTVKSCIRIALKQLKRFLLMEDKRTETSIA